ncbi:hypothetical protein RHSIM_Rhsim12G0071800 [Rhododendron simsii]|uniref:Cytochrome P450 n=1 Tax=Rhododendron simsii TaxID=118357 RepID=A0A834G3U9_RHOSS|nr:hypothetical protein RHSIM_Rhsim12G0071800 [Rhododendron simsii]
MIVTFLSTGLCIFLVIVLVRFLHTVWWTPIRIRHIMASQGIKGPAYKFLHGNTKEIVRMRGESISTPMDYSSHPIFARLMPDIHAWKQLYGRNYLSWHGPKAQLVVTDPELIKEIINNKDGAYLKGKPDQFSKKLLGDGIAVTEGEKWLKLRKIANHAFYAESLKGMVPAMITSVETMLERWKQHEEKEIEVYKESRLLTAEVISRTAFGSSYLEGEKIFAMLMEMGTIMARNRYKIRLPGIGILSSFAGSVLITNSGRNYLSWYGPQAQLVVTDSELIKEIMNNKDGVYLKGRPDQFSKKLLGDGISVAEGEKWSKLRKIANHAFYAESLKGMVPAMIASVETMLERWTQHEEKEIEVNKESRLLTSEVISRTAFGSSYLEGEKIFDMLMKMGLIVARNRFKIRLPGSGKFWKSRDVLESDKIEQAIRESIIGMINKREEKMACFLTCELSVGVLGIIVSTIILAGRDCEHRRSRFALCAAVLCGVQRREIEVIRISPSGEAGAFNVALVTDVTVVLWVWNLEARLRQRWELLHLSRWCRLGTLQQLKLKLCMEFGQGIKGPAYRFLHGNTKEIIQMRGESISSPMDFSSHHIFARITPDIHAWKQLYAGLVGQFSEKLLGDGIVVTEGEKWLKLRKIANHTFYAESLKGMVPAMIASVKTMLERWRQHEEKQIVVYKESRLLTVEVIFRTALESSYLKGEKIFNMLMKMGMIMARNHFKICLSGIGKFLKSRDNESDKLEQAIRESIIGVINKREEKMMKGEENNYGSDFLESLIKANHDIDEKNRISIDDMVDECKTFYLAGQETTNGLLAWNLLASSNSHKLAREGKKGSV